MQLLVNNLSERLLVLERSDSLAFLLLDYDIWLLNWIRVQFTLQVKINE